MTQALTRRVESPPDLPESPELIARRRRGLFFLGLAVGCVGFTMALQLGLNSNYVADTMGLTGQQQGYLEASRESCGITALVVLALLAGLAEPLVGAIMLVLLAVGLGAYWIVPRGQLGLLIVASLVWSQGLHVWMPLPNSMAMSLAEPGRTGRRLGQVAAAGSAGSFLGLALALVLHKLGVPIRPLYLLAAAVAMLAAAACLRIPRDLKTPGPRLVFRRKYWLYYLLSFLEGWRKQIFIAFAGFLLVVRYRTPLQTMLVLWIISNFIGYIAAHLVGRIIDRLGERRVLVFYYAAMMLIFLGYEHAADRRLLYALFVADNVFFVCAMALTTIVSRLAPPEEYTPTLSMGVAVNHVAAVLMPLIGGYLWGLGYQWTFRVGTAAALASVLVALLAPTRRKTMTNE